MNSAPEVFIITQGHPTSVSTEMKELMEQGQSARVILELIPLYIALELYLCQTFQNHSSQNMGWYL